MFISTAGIGSRVAGLGIVPNKSMLPVNYEPIITKILDKFDNIFIIGLNSKDEIRMKYLDEIRKYIIPMTSKFIPKLFDDFNLCCNEAETLGYFPK